MLNKDFENDLKNEIKSAANEIGIKISLDGKLDKILRDYLTVRFKLIDIKKRNVLFNPDFLNTLDKHPKKKEIHAIRKFAQDGKNLNIFQSKRLLQTQFHDHLMGEWNIYHFHLSLKIDRKSKFVKQVNNLLFVYIEDDFIIFLGTDKHREGIFGDTKWIEILHDHYPQFIAKYKHNSIKEVYPKVNGIERQMLWNKGYTLGMTKIRDSVYFNPGIGRSASGHSSAVVKSEIEILRWIYKLNDQLDDYGMTLCEYLGVKHTDIEFKIKLDEELYLQVQPHGKKLLTFPEILISKDELIRRLNMSKKIN